MQTTDTLQKYGNSTYFLIPSVEQLKRFLRKFFMHKIESKPRPYSGFRPFLISHKYKMCYNHSKAFRRETLWARDGTMKETIKSANKCPHLTIVTDCVSVFTRVVFVYVRTGPTRESIVRFIDTILQFADTKVNHLDI